jgi:hypothetical protein
VSEVTQDGADIKTLTIPRLGSQPRYPGIRNFGLTDNDHPHGLNAAIRAASDAESTELVSCERGFTWPAAARHGFRPRYRRMSGALALEMPGPAGNWRQGPGSRPAFRAFRTSALVGSRFVPG